MAAARAVDSVSTDVRGMMIIAAFVRICCVSSVEVWIRVGSVSGMLGWQLMASVLVWKGFI